MKKEEDLKSDLLQTKNPEVPKPDYSDDEMTYLKNIRIKMEDAKAIRDTMHDEFDGMDYVTYYETNERLANTFIQPKKNKEDTNFQSGTIRQKLFALLAAITNLDLRGDISAFNDDGFQIQALGDAMEDVILKTNELDGDDEKKYLRHYELLKQGTVFVEELWEEKDIVKKRTNRKFDGKLKNFDFTKSIKKAFARPTRNIIPGLNVYLGDITQYDIAQQPYIFTIDTVSYSKAKAMFGDWERWKYVPKKMQRFNSNEKGSLFNYDWTLLETRENYVEILRYQDKWSNEFALILNGVLMTPVGLPLPWGYEEYNIAQQNLEAINAKFAYGKSLVSRIKNKVAIMDELMRLAILKTQKSFMPPYLNISGRVLSNRVFMPGKISHGIAPNTLIPINAKEAEGVTNAELAMVKELKDSIDHETTSPIFSGQQPSSGGATATEIVELQRQAKMILGLTIFSISLLEWKLEWLRLKNILANWFNAEDEVVDEARGILKSKFRKVSTDYMVSGEGMGKRIIIPIKDEMPSSEAVMKTEDQLSQEQGMPIRLIFLNPDEVTNAKLIWQIIVRPKERKTSEVNKLLFRAFMQDIMPLGPNVSYLQEKAASVWEENPQKLFAPNTAPAVGPDGQPIQTGQEGQNGTLSPRVNLPSPEQAAGRQVKSSLQTST